MTQQWRFTITLCLGLLFFLYPRHALAANWQKLPNFSDTVVGAFANTDTTLYAGIHQEVSQRLTENGLYKIEGDGLAVTKTYTNKDFGVQDLVANAGKLYAAIPSNGFVLPWGVYQSDDNGATWNRISQNLSRPHALATNGSVFLAGAYGGLYKSTDGGVTWVRKIQNDNTFDEFNHVAIQGNLAFAASPSSFYKSTDAGETWQPIAAPLNANRYLAIKSNVVIGGSTSANGVFLSEDGGATWQSFKGNFTNAEFVSGPFVFGNGNDVFAGGIHQVGTTATGTMFVSHDLGKTWQKIDGGITHAATFTQAITAVSFLQNKVYMAMYQDGIFTLDITPSPPPTPTQLPVIFIPGIGGSEFKANDSFSATVPKCGGPDTETFQYSKDETIWVNIAKAALLACDDYFDVLKLQADGATPAYDKIVLKGTVFEGAYDKTADFFTSHGYTQGKDFFFFPYDWRKDIRSTTPLLEAKINEILTTTHADKVQIVAHSMGGLVAREYIRDASRATKVDTLVELGVPHLGATSSLVNLIYGDCFGPKKFGVCAGISASEIEDVAQNMTGIYELLNSSKYFDLTTLKPFRDDRDIDNNGVTGELDYQQTNELLKNLNKNAGALSINDSFHTVLDQNNSNNNGVKIDILAGSGLPTVGQIREYTKTTLGLIKTNKRDLALINGDQTVSLLSATLNNQGVYYTNIEHGELASANTSLTQVINLLHGSTQMISGVQSSPFVFKGKTVSTHSPVELHAYDSSGNHTGPKADGNFEENIPGSSYEKLDDATFIYLPEGGTYRTETKATAAESFDLKVKNYQNDALSSETLFLDIPQTQQTQTTLDLKATNPALIIDQNGDGTTDAIVPPTSVVLGAAIADTTAPVTTASVVGAVGQNSWYLSDVTVTLVGQDEASGSGILRTEYSLDNWQTVLPYSQPFTITTEGTTDILYRSVDNIGNEEQPKSLQFQIDKTQPVITLTNRTPANSNGWNNNDVTVTWSCIDSLSGPPESSISQTVTAEGNNLSATGTCIDNAGNSSSDVQGDIKIDRTAPTVSIGGVTNGAIYTLGSIPTATCNTSDQLSGVATNASLTITGGTANGVGTFTVTCGGAKDNADNPGPTIKLTYQVQYNFSGFFDPVDNPPVLNVTNAGRTIPLKWSLGGVSALSSLSSLQWNTVRCSTLTGETSVIDATTTGTTTLHYDTATGQFIDNLATKSNWSGTCQQLLLKLDDGTSQTANFKFK